MPKEEDLISVLLVGGEPMMLDSLQLVLEAREDIRVLERTAPGPKAIALANTHAPDIIMVTELGAGSAMPFLESLANENVRIPRVVVSERSDDAWRDDVQRAGVDATLPRGQTASDAVATIREIVERAKDPEWRPGAAAHRRLSSTERMPLATRGATVLSRRQRQVLARAAAGESVKEIASALGVSVKTVDTHKAIAMSRLNLSSRTELMRYAVSQRWLDDL